MRNPAAKAQPRPVPTLFDSIRSHLIDALGPSIGVACRDVNGDPALLWSVERTTIQHAVPRRQREFAAGRAAARVAMEQVSSPPAPLHVGQDRAPVWPAGLVGSIAHSSRVCVAVAAWRNAVCSIGIDIEDDAPLEPNLWPIICTPEEIAGLHTLPEKQRGHRVTQIFCAKEAYYKWQYPLTGFLLEFTDVQVQLNNDQSFVVSHYAGSPLSRSMADAPAGGLMTLHGSVIAWVTGAPKENRLAKST